MSLSLNRGELRSGLRTSLLSFHLLPSLPASAAKEPEYGALYESYDHTPFDHERHSQRSASGLYVPGNFSFGAGVTPLSRLLSLAITLKKKPLGLIASSEGLLRFLIGGTCVTVVGGRGVRHTHLLNRTPNCRSPLYLGIG